MGLLNPRAKKIIVAGGVVSYGKRAEFFIELFSELKKHQKNYKTAYIGSAGGWSKKFESANLRLEHELKKVTDLFYGQLRPADVAKRLSESAIGVLNPLYETCNRFGMEMMASGVPRVCSEHICYDNTLNTARFKGIEGCISVLATLTRDFEELPDETYSQELRKYALDHYSYEATQNQLNDYLRMIL